MENVFTIARDANNDIFVKNGKSFAIVSGIDAYAQIINAKMRTIKNEMILDMEGGLPYFENVFLDSSKILFWEQSAKTMLKNISFVTRVVKFDTRVENGVLKYNSVVLTDLGELPVHGNIQYSQRKKKTEESKIAYIVKVHTGIESIPDYEIAYSQGDVIKIDMRSGFKHTLFLDAAHTIPVMRLMPSHRIDVYVKWEYDPESGLAYEEAMMDEWRAKASKFEMYPNVWIVKIDNPDTTKVTVMTNGVKSGDYIDWGDGTRVAADATSAQATHKYSNSGYYMVASSTSHSYINDGTTASTIVALVQIGEREDRTWLNKLCFQCTNLVAAYIEIPTSVTYMARAFTGCEKMKIVNDVSLESLCPDWIHADTAPNPNDRNYRWDAYTGCSDEVRAKAYVSFGGTVPDPEPEE